ncbi:MAG: deoxyguanosine kinase [Planctomycetota bacterium]|jgi:deoxyguanosine kinase
MADQFRYIVVEGPIGVGKTSLATRLSKEYGAGILLEKAEENPFLANYYKNPRQFALSTQLHFLLQRAQQVQEFRQSDMFQRTQVADFMIEKDRLFAELTLEIDELALYEQIYQHLTLDAPKPDLVIYLQAPLDALRDRIIQRGIEYEQQIRDDYLLRLSESYTRFFHDYTDSALLTINTQAIDPINNQHDYEQILDKINNIHCGRHYFNQSSFAY